MSFSAKAAEPVPDAIPATVLRVIDGDTLEVVAHVWIGLAVTTRVRLKGIDTPELSEPCEEARTMARKARQLVERMAGRKVMLSRVETGKYAGRVLAEITVDGADVAKALLNAGLARPYGGGKRQGWCGEYDLR